MRTKEGANISHLRPEIMQLFPTIDAVYWAWNKTPVITSGNDGKHMQNSLHYANLALDLRIKHVGEWPARRSLYQALRDEINRLYPGWYDVLHEQVGTDAEHLHVEAAPLLLGLIEGAQKELIG